MINGSSIGYLYLYFIKYIKHPLYPQDCDITLDLVTI